MAPCKSVRPFAEALLHSPSRLAARAEAGEKQIGYFCTHTPVELLLACGFAPVRISGGPGRVERAYALAPDFICPFMKRALEKAMGGAWQNFSGLVQGYTCDVACGMVNVWAENVGGDLCHSLSLPYNDTPRAREYFRAEIEAFVKKAERAGGKFSLEALEHALDLYAAIRRCLSALAEAGSGGGPALSAADRHLVFQAGFVTPPKVYLSMLEKLCPEIAGAPCGPGSGVPVMVSGSLVESSTVFADMERAGARIIADDLCTGYRQLEPADGKGENPLERLIDRYMRRAPCPSRCRAEDRFPRLRKRMEKAGARAMIFLLQKFCTPHLADVPALAQMLRAAGLPSLVVEMDESWRIDGQQQTRLEGFVEMLA